MKFAMAPRAWEETVSALEEAGHQHVGIGEAQALVFNGNPEDFPDAPHLELVQVPFAGVDHLLDTMRGHDAVWSNAAGVYDSTVAESTLGLLLAQLHAHARVGKTWSNRKEVEAHTSFLGADKTVAIVGAGGIGKRLIELLQPFNVRVIAVNRSGNTVPGASETVAFSELDSVWPRADYFVALAPLTEETSGIFDAKAFAAMPDHAVVINVGRGPLVDTGALVQALRDGSIAGAGLDVTDPEPLPDGHPLWDFSQVVITPHLANPPYSVRRLIGAHAAEVFDLFAAGKPIPTQVDIAAGY